MDQARAPRPAIDVRDPAIRLALVALLDEASLDMELGEVLITDVDADTRRAPVVILVVRTSGRCCDALAALVADRCDAVIHVAEIDRVGAVLHSVKRAGFVATPSVIRGALAAPDISGRQRRVLMALAEGASNKQIGLQLDLSIATVKREVSALLTAFNLGGRGELIAAGREWALECDASRAAPGDASWSSG